MIKFTSVYLSKLGQSFLDEISDVDWGDDDNDGFESSGRISPDESQGIVDENNFEQFEPSLAEPQRNYNDFNESDYLREIPTTNELLGIPPDTQEVEYDSPLQLVYDGIDNNEVISFDYTNRFGQYAGTRVVEPHYTFMAQTTGNEVLVTFDRDQNGIRAFIVGNIHPYGVRYKDVNFDPRGEIMRGIY